jgi:hypothetical protein
MQLRKLGLVLAGATVMAPTLASAVEIKAGDWTVNVGGFVNAFYTTVSCTGDQTIGGLALAGKALGCAGKDDATTIGNGLLPNALVTSFATKQNGYDLGGTIMIGNSTATGDAIGQNNVVDVRQAFFTVGSDAGTFKLGRDYGAFGANAILSDMTLIGVGAPVQATQKGRVSLGHIGAGYTYLGHYGQISYSAPASSPVGLTVGVYSPVGNWVGTADATKTPQFQAVASVAANGMKGWLGGKYQKFDNNPGPGDFKESAVEIGGSYSGGGFGLLGNYQTGKGLGVLTDGDAGDAKQTNIFVQATFDATADVKLGLNYGQNKLKDGSGSALEKNDNITGGVYYKLTKSVTLLGEVSQSKSKSFDGKEAKLHGVSVGGIVFF